MTLAGGVLALLTGVMLLIWPGKTLLVVAALLGVWLLLMGIVRIVRTFTTKTTWGMRALTALAGLLYIVVGVICLRNLFESLEVLAMVLGLVWIVGGGAELFSANGFTGKLIAVLTILAGLAVLFWPGLSLITMTVVIGLWLIVIGIIQLVMWWSARSKPHRSQVVA